MTARFIPLFDVSVGWGTDSTQNEYPFAVDGTEDEVEAKACALANLPVTYLGLLNTSFRLAHVGAGNWSGAAVYARKAASFSFDVSGTSQHITQSIRTVQRYGVGPGDPPDFGGAIGVNGDSVEGCDVQAPQATWSETHYLPASVVDAAYKKTLRGLVGKVNDAAFKSDLAGECLFTGVSGSQHGDDDWEITFKFATSENRDDITVGDLGPITKAGWEYLWVRYEDDVSNNALVKRPTAAYVEQVYHTADFSAIGIGT